MSTEKAAYWLALAAFGFAFQGVCPRGALQNLNHALGHTGSTLCRLATNAERAVMASMLISHPRAQQHGDWSVTNAQQLAQVQSELAQAQIDRVQDQAEAIRERALAQAAMARAELELHRAEIQHLQLRIRPQIRFSHAVNRRFLAVSNYPCDYSRVSDAVRASIELSGEQ